MTIWYFDAHKRYQRISAVKLINTSVTSHLPVFYFYFGENVFLNRFRYYDTVLSTISSCCKLDAQTLLDLRAGNLSSFTNLFLFFQHPGTWQPLFYFVSMSLTFLDSAYKWCVCVCVCVCVCARVPGSICFKIIFSCLGYSLATFPKPCLQLRLYPAVSSDWGCLQGEAL